MLVADNLEALNAARLFRECEGIDIDPAAGVALATLIQAVTSGQIDRNALVLLNITGGGWDRHRRDNGLISAKPALQIDMYEMAMEQILEKVIGLF